MLAIAHVSSDFSVPLKATHQLSPCLEALWNSQDTRRRYGVFKRSGDSLHIFHFELNIIWRTQGFYNLDSQI